MGSVVISVDAELAWGVHDRYPLSPSETRRVAAGRPGWDRLVDLFDEFAIPATWAVVGHLLAEDADALQAGHPLSERWFDTYRREVDEHPEWWHATDLVEAVVAASAGHELASHSFSHVVFAGATRETAEAECRLARTVGDGFGLELTSFVFPRNAVAHREALASAGFDCYRGVRPRRLPAVPGLRGTAMLAGALTGAVAPPVVRPRLDEHGLVELPASMALGGFRGPPWSILEATGAAPAGRLAELGIDRASERDGVFHLWLHPNDLTDERYVRRVRSVLSSLADRRDDGDVRVETMAGVARRVREVRRGE